MANWTAKPHFPTQSALLAQRKFEMRPPMSYDFDGDGYVRATAANKQHLQLGSPSPAHIVNLVSPRCTIHPITRSTTLSTLLAAD